MDEKETIPKEQYLRLAADFDNYRKRMEQGVKDAVQFGNERLLLEIADVLDVKERSQTESYDVSALLEQLLQKQGVTRIETKEKSFDPATMEAVGTVEGGASQMVQSEVRAGYQIRDRVIRPARVIIYQ